jgi:DHA1 family bicyclomycin/chloramphenicol resistance-like MFS transporter
MTGAAAVAIARAIAIEQTADERESAKLLSRLMVVAGIAPIAAPLIGGSLVHLAGWRAIFLALAAAGAVIWTTTLIVVPPAGSPRSARPRPRVTTVLGDPRFARYSLALACASVALFTYIAASPSLLETDYRLSPAAFAAIFAANAAGLLATTLLNTMALTRLGPRRLSAAAFAIQLPASLAFAIAANQHAPLIVLAPIMFVQIAPLGVLLPNTAALALDSHRPSAGTASALLGFTQFAIGAAVSPLGAHPATATLLAVPAAATGLALVGIPTPPGWPSEPRFFRRDPKTSSHQGGLVGFEESLKGHRSAV